MVLWNKIISKTNSLILWDFNFYGKYYKKKEFIKWYYLYFILFFCLDVLRFFGSLRNFKSGSLQMVIFQKKILQILKS